jgi:cytochrome c556
MKHPRTCLRILLASVCLVAGTAFAAESEDIIKYRQNVMKANGAHMAAAGAIINGKVDFKGQLGDHAKALQTINKDINSLFPKDSDFGETKALDAVWKNNADFQKRARDSAQKADALAKTVASGDSRNYAARFKELSDSCKACHKDFRKEEQ